MLFKFEVGNEEQQAQLAARFPRTQGPRATTATTMVASCPNEILSASSSRASSSQSPTSSRRTSLPTLSFLLVLFITLLSFPTPSAAIKFELAASQYPTQRCIWNYAHKNALIIITANVSPGKAQRVDVEVRDREGGAGNIYLNKRDIKGETRLAVTAHAEGDVGVCFKNTLDAGKFSSYFPKSPQRCSINPR